MHDPQRDRRTGPAVKADGGGWFENWWKKVVTNKGEPTGVDRGASDVKGSERGATGRGVRWQKRARGAGLQGPIGTWGAGQGHQDSEREAGAGGRWEWTLV